MASASKEPTTTIRLQDLTFHAPIGCDTWGRPAKPTQPISFSISVRIVLSRHTAIADDLNHSLDYSKLASLVLSVAQQPQGWGETLHSDPIAFHNDTWLEILRTYSNLTHGITMSTTLPVNMLASSTKAIWHSSFDTTDESPTGWKKDNMLELSDIHAATIIGIREHEKIDAQTVRVHVRVNVGRIGDDPVQLAKRGTLAHSIVRDVVETVRNARVGTVEALVAILWDMFLRVWAQPNSIEVLKPDAVAFVGGAGVAMEAEDD